MIINMNGAKAPETPSPVMQEKTVTPETLPTVIGADEGYDGLSQVTVNPDSQLKAENIRSGKTIFGVTGAFTGEPYEVPNKSAELLSKISSIGDFDPEGSTVVIGEFTTGLIQNMYLKGPLKITRPTSGSMMIFRDKCLNIYSEYPIELVDCYPYVATTTSYNANYNISGRLAYPLSYPYKKGDSSPAPRYNAMFSRPRIVLPPEDFFGTGSFYNCLYTPDKGNTYGSLTIVFPAEVTYIHVDAVYGGDNYPNIVEFTSPTPPSGLVEAGCFRNVSKIIVPVGSLDSYKAVFTGYVDIIEEKSA